MSEEKVIPLNEEAREALDREQKMKTAREWLDHAAEIHDEMMDRNVTSAALVFMTEDGFIVTSYVAHRTVTEAIGLLELVKTKIVEVGDD